MEYISAKEAAVSWGISQRRVAVLCSEKRIPGAERVGNMWLIPKTAAKPGDARHSRRRGSETAVKPFLKWAGGKGQLLKELEQFYPFEKGRAITKYAEPFVGGGAVLFDILNRFDLKEIYISDTNRELIGAYLAVRDNLPELTALLAEMQAEFTPLGPDARKRCYYAKRKQFNELKTDGTAAADILKSALLIFLNRTCFNGLYRVNKRGLFNVPMGAYKNPLICDEKNLAAVSAKLQRVQMVCGDYRESASFIDKHTFVYFDPPYRPITDTSSFTAYTETVFDDRAQKALAEFAVEMGRRGAKILVSNSDPRNVNGEDGFFDAIYSAFTIKRVEASRMINSDSGKRGKIRELLISNF